MVRCGVSKINRRLDFKTQTKINGKITKKRSFC